MIEGIILAGFLSFCEPRHDIIVETDRGPGAIECIERGFGGISPIQYRERAGERWGNQYGGGTYDGMGGHTYTPGCWNCP